MGNKDIMEYIKNIQVNVDNNCHLFKNSMDYG